MALRKSAPLFLPSSSPRVTVSLERLTIRVGVGAADVAGVVETGGVADAAGVIGIAEVVDVDEIGEVVEAVCVLVVELSAPPDPVVPEPSPMTATRL